MITRCQAEESLEQLGSGVRNLFKYSRFYSGQDPEFVEGDIFKIIVPLDDNYSLDYGNGANGDSGCGTIDTISTDRVREPLIPYAAEGDSCKRRE